MAVMCIPECGLGFRPIPVVHVLLLCGKYWRYLGFTSSFYVPMRHIL